MHHAAIERLKQQDPEIWAACLKEQARQEETIELIASENYTSLAVMAAQGSCFTNKYAEGYPRNRYYSGCEWVDQVETLAIERAKALFQADYANVQPHSGSQANAAVYLALLKPGETLLGLDLTHGGHLTHGFSVSSSGKYYRSVAYGLNAEGRIDYEQVNELAHRHQPKLIIGGFSAYSRTVDWGRLRSIADEVGAYLMADMAHIAGPVAAGLLPSPLPHAHVVTCTTHKTLAGPRGGMILAAGGSDALYKKLNAATFPGMQGGPLPHVIAAKAVAFGEALQPSFKAYQSRVLQNAQVMAERFLQRGFRLVSGGTENHLFLVDLRGHDLSGQAAEKRLYEAKIALNKNTVPNDPRGPVQTSGLRIGSPAMTRRGMGPKEAVELVDWMAALLSASASELPHLTPEILKQVKELCQRFPVYAHQIQ